MKPSFARTSQRERRIRRCRRLPRAARIIYHACHRQLCHARCGTGPGTSGALAKVLALPLFCIVVMADSIAQCGAHGKGIACTAYHTRRQGSAAQSGRDAGDCFWPFDSGDGWAALSTGMVLGRRDGNTKRHSPHSHGRIAADHHHDRQYHPNNDRSGGSLAGRADRDARSDPHTPVTDVGQRNRVRRRMRGSGADLCEAGHLVLRAAAGDCGVYPVVGGVNSGKN